MSEELDVLAALKQWGEMAYEGDPIVDVLLNDISRAVDRIEALEKENFALAANQCAGGYSGERGDHMCKFRDMADGYGKLDAEYASSQARLSEAVKVLEKFNAHYPMGINPFLDEAGRAAKAFLATLGEET